MHSDYARVRCEGNKLKLWAMDLHQVGMPLLFLKQLPHAGNLPSHYPGQIGQLSSI